MLFFHIHVWYPYYKIKGLVSKYELLLPSSSSSAWKKKKLIQNSFCISENIYFRLEVSGRINMKKFYKKPDVNWLAEEHQPIIWCFKHYIKQQNFIWGKWTAERIAEHWDFSIPSPEVLRYVVWRFASSTSCVQSCLFLFPVISNYDLWTQWAQAEYYPKFSYVWCGLSSYLGHGLRNGFYLQVSLCMQVCLHPVTSDQRFSYLCSLSEMTGNLYSSLFGYLADELIFSHLGPPLLQRAGLHCEWLESTSSVCVVLGATPTPWLALLDPEQTAEHVGPTCPWRLSQQLLPNPADLCENLQRFVMSHVRLHLLHL